MISLTYTQYEDSASFQMRADDRFSLQVPSTQVRVIRLDIVRHRANINVLLWIFFRKIKALLRTRFGTLSPPPTHDTPHTHLHVCHTFISHFHVPLSRHTFICPSIVPPFHLGLSDFHVPPIHLPLRFLMYYLPTIA